MNETALKELLYKMADDQLIIGHRNSEWTGMGPLLEEDIAFSSMAQDKVGQSHALYQILHSLGESEPDTIAFTRNAEQFHNCTLTELPNGEYDFSLIRHFLFDTAEAIRFELLTESSYTPLAQLAKKIQGEIRYHTMHANTWIKQLGTATEESISRLQSSLDKALPYALGIFEPSPYEQELIAGGIFQGEEVLKEKWINRITEILSQTSLQLPDLSVIEPEFGGRTGKHTEHLQPLVEEMSEVFRIDPGAEW
ncbi:phenylacetate-CoA oxygenase subunit PaaC [Fulvivirga kasyanovii]|uniref:Phenylacetate-CoA oxygenase subunit PaaI n=1 Tax=Fulvivirga kasyanovii TaxID=396812 RepID=A0ABW9RIP1_9BACT|nr:1,2-phenylacetyl-CoA epoxidase subunit PaaC [Fulvivirga kasyanovii]MTI23561.1 phenylacetate-CoA oxygenase subunit PaaI [Fulvivirga kasyanovii]